MKRLIMIGLSALLAVTNACAQEAAPDIQERIDQAKERLGDELLTTADEVIARHVEAIGGREAILSIKTLAFEGKIMRFGPGDPIIYRFYQQPNLLRATRSPENIHYFVTDGGDVWYVTPEGRQKKTEWWAESMSHHRIDGNFLDYEERGIEYEYLGLNGFALDPHVYYHLRRTFPDGVVEELYFDVETGLLHGINPLSSPREGEVGFHFDYRDIGGMLFACIWTRWSKSVSPTHILVIENIRVNEEFGEDFFTEYESKPVLE